MHRIIYFSIISIFILYLAYYITTPKEGYVDSSERDISKMGITGIASICTPDSPSYGDRTACFDISYVDTATRKIVQTKAQIADGYFIDASGFLEIVPYGYIVSSDKHSYITKTNTSAYGKASVENTNSDIDRRINELQTLIRATLPSDNATIQDLQTQIDELKQQKVTTIMESNQTSNTSYNSDNLDVTYHTDPTKETPPDANNLLVGQMWINDASGNLQSVPYSDVKNTTHYYPAGSYVFNPPAYVPNYEESVFLSKITNLPTVIAVNLPQTIDFCADTESSTINREIRCNALDSKTCGSSRCCVLFGGEKCVAGDSMGPSIKSNYSDRTIINRDYYYYKGTCYGNCP